MSQAPAAGRHTVDEASGACTQPLAMLHESVVQMLPSSQLGGVPGAHVPCASQISAESTTPLPQLAGQSGSLPLLAPAGQHPSAAPIWVMLVCVQCAWQVPSPTSVSIVHGSLSLQSVGHTPAPPMMAVSQSS